MPAWSFQPRFRAALLNGLAEAAGEPPPFPELRPKRQTIRNRRRDGRDPKPGQRVGIWIAQRTPEREFLGQTPPIRRLELRVAHAGAFLLNGSRLSAGAATKLARRDGFEDADEFAAFLERYHGLPFAGFRFRW